MLLDIGRNEKIELAFSSLPQEIVPLYFPVFCKGRRKAIQALLREQNIYASIIWPKSILMHDTSETV
ncbi:hypothetical protein, partial [Eubacterium aggregans]|uniref:hypothetical protein n=1 Tax=Eubacterium aggregans TaxID=81409 RepID=UPI003F34822F